MHQITNVIFSNVERCGRINAEMRKHEIYGFTSKVIKTIAEK